MKNKVPALIVGGMATLGLLAGIATMASAQTATVKPASATVQSTAAVDTPEVGDVADKTTVDTPEAGDTADVAGQ